MLRQLRPSVKAPEYKLEDVTSEQCSLMNGVGQENWFGLVQQEARRHAVDDTTFVGHLNITCRNALQEFSQALSIKHPSTTHPRKIDQNAVFQHVREKVYRLLLADPIVDGAVDLELLRTLKAGMCPCSLLFQLLTIQHRGPEWCISTACAKNKGSV